MTRSAEAIAACAADCMSASSCPDTTSSPATSTSITSAARPSRSIRSGSASTSRVVPAIGVATARS